LVDHRISERALPARSPVWRFLPAAAPPEIRLLLWAKGLRGFGDGLIAILLPLHLLRVGLDALEIGILSTATLFGSAVLMLAVGRIGHRADPTRLLIAASLLMAATGAGFAFFSDFWILLVVAFIGTLNPSAGDVSVFLPLEQAQIAHRAADRQRTDLFARYSLVGSLSSALGALAATFPEAAAAWSGVAFGTALRLVFAFYAAIGVVVLLLYRRLPAPTGFTADPSPGTLGPSRRIVYGMAALFSLDAFAGGFIVQSLLALWLFERFGLSLAAAGSFFFWSGVLTAFSYLVAVPVARRIGLVNTMVFTHLPANLLLVLVPFMPSLGPALALLLLRAALSQMDVPTRTSYVMAVVTPPERPAAASMTAVPRSLAAAVSPALAGSLLAVSTIGWPLLIGGVLKIVYDLLFLAAFRGIKPPEEEGRSA
jgi:MFS family permease